MENGNDKNGERKCFKQNRKLTKVLHCYCQYFEYRNIWPYFCVCLLLENQFSRIDKTNFISHRLSVRLCVCNLFVCVLCVFYIKLTIRNSIWPATVRECNRIGVNVGWKSTFVARAAALARNSHIIQWNWCNFIIAL